MAGLAAGAAPGQQSELPGPDFFMDVRTGLVVTDNYDDVEDPEGTSTILQTNVVLGFDSITKNQTISIRMGTEFEFGAVPESVDFRQGRNDPFLTVAYARSSKTAELTFDTSFSERDNGFSTIENDFTGDDLVIDDGTRRDFSAAVGLETGKGTPLGFEGRVAYNTTLYSDTTNSDLSDLERWRADLSLRMSLNRTTDLRFNTRYSQRDEQDEFDTLETNLSYGVSLTTLLDPSLEMVVALNHAVNEVETTTAGTTTIDREEGPTFELGFEKTVKNGSFGADLSSSLGGSGTLTTLQFSRDLQLRSGTLETMFGATWTADDKIHAIGRIALTHQLKRSTFQGILEQAVRTDDDDEDEIISRAAAIYGLQLTQVSDVSMAANFTSADDLAEDGVDREQKSVSITYNHTLTRDWTFSTGVSHSVSSNTERDDITENRLFANIGRRFSLRP